MIITVAPYPTVQYGYDIDNLQPDTIMHTANSNCMILSKGIYSAKMIKILQDDPVLLSVLGGFAGKYIKHELDKSKIKADVIWSTMDTPHTIQIRETTTNKLFTIANPTQTVPTIQTTKLDQKVLYYLKQQATMVVCGYFPNQELISAYEKWLELAKNHHIKTLVSTRQEEVLQAALKKVPYALLFTEKQLHHLGIKWTTPTQLIEQLYPFLNKGVHYVGVYLFNHTGWMLSKNKICEMVYMGNQKVENHFMASGAFIGAFSIGIHRKYEQEKIAKMCLGAAISAHNSSGKSLCTKKDVDTHTKKVKIREYISE